MEVERVFNGLTCRVCLSVQELMVDIYEEVEELNTDLSSLLEQCGDLKVDRCDIYPKYLCKECTSELLIAAKFREKCSKTKDVLHEYETNLISRNDFYETSIEAEADEYFPSDYVVLSNEVDIKPQNLDDDRENSNVDINTSPANHHSDNLDVRSVRLCDQNGKNTLIRNTDDIIVFDEEELVAVPAVGIIKEELEANEQNSKIILSNFNYICDNCGAAFANAQNLLRHIKSHSSSQLYTCRYCAHCFTIEENLHNHKSNCHEDKTNHYTLTGESAGINESKNFSQQDIEFACRSNKSCTYCNKQCKTTFALKMHLRTHTGERPYKCELCPKSFKTRSTLTGHLKRHAGVPDYICQYCNKTFFENSNLLAHVRTHTGEKPHACLVCGKRFTRVFLLQLHTRTHTGEKPYKCDVCNRPFAQLCDMRNHMRIHTGERLYQCTLCPKSFIKRRPLRMHMERHTRSLTD